MSKPYYETLDKGGYKHRHNRNFFDGWKIHFQPSEEITEQELDSFFSRHEVAQWKTAKPGSEDFGTGKQITAYTGDRDKTIKIVDELHSEFGNKLVTSRLPKDEESLNKVTARFNIQDDPQGRYHQYGQHGVSFTNEAYRDIHDLERYSGGGTEGIRHGSAHQVYEEMKQKHGEYFTGTGDRAFKIEENINDQKAKAASAQILPATQSNSIASGQIDPIAKSTPSRQSPDPIATVTNDPSSVAGKADEPMRAASPKFQRWGERLGISLEPFRGGEPEMSEDHPLRKIFKERRENSVPRRPDRDPEFLEMRRIHEGRHVAQELSPRNRAKAAEINKSLEDKELFTDLERLWTDGQERHREQIRNNDFPSRIQSSAAPPISKEVSAPDPIATVTKDPSSVVTKANEPIKAPVKKYEIKRRPPGTTVSQPTPTPAVPPVISQSTPIAATSAAVLPSTTPPVSSTSTSPPIIKPPHRPVDPATMARDEAGHMDIITEGAPYAKRNPVARRGRMDEKFLPTDIPRQPDPFRETPITEGIPKKTPSLMSRLPMKSIGGAIGGAMVGRFFAGDEEGQKTAGMFMGAASGAGFTSVIENYYKSQNSSIQANYLSTVKGMDAKFKSEQQYMAKLEATPINDPRNFSQYRDWREATDRQLGVSASNTLGPVAPEITTALAIIPNRENVTLSKEAAMSMRRDAQNVRRTARTNNKMVTAGLAVAATVATAGIGLSFSGGDKSSGINSKRGL